MRVCELVHPILVPFSTTVSMSLFFRSFARAVTSVSTPVPWIASILFPPMSGNRRPMIGGKNP